jgi:hypothetical protein
VSKPPLVITNEELDLLEHVVQQLRAAQRSGEPDPADVTALAALLVEGPGFAADTSTEIATWLLCNGVHL